MFDLHIISEKQISCLTEFSLAPPPGFDISAFDLQVSHSFANQFMLDFHKADLSLMANPCVSSCHLVPELILSYNSAISSLGFSFQ